RIYTVAGTATTGQFFAGLPAAAALAAGQTTDIQGVEESSAFRTNVGWVEVTGNPCSIQVQRVDGNGVVLASQTFNVQPYAVEQRGSILNQLGGPGANQRLRISVVSGTGKILAFGSRLDNASNDPSTIEMRTQTLVDRSRGTYGGFFASSGVVTGGLSFQLTSGGVLGFQATGMVDCGGVPYTLDLGPNQTAVALDSQNTFTLALTHDYFDGSTKVLTVAWTVSGTVTSSGTSTGALTGQVTFKASQAPWNSCVGLTQPWEAGWVKP
ncbi:MAG: hypothetical protein N2447_09585, partial [Thermoanaerobaculum sp.]|nr:hypothetical protein [Thermoanaerobaculum sp.]